MQSYKKFFENFYAELFAGLVFFAAVAFIRLPFIAGSFASFSLIKGSVPLLGILGMQVTGLFFVLRTIIRVVVHGVSLYNVLQYAPSFAGSLYWATKSMWVRVGIPVMCMLFFIAHPTGFAAAPYALYWLIPVVIYFAAPTSIFSQSLASTFTMHAVGSLVWLYSGLLTSQEWIALIPVVAVERLLLASAMTVLYHTLGAMKSAVVHYYFAKKGLAQ